MQDDGLETQSSTMRFASFIDNMGGDLDEMSGTEMTWADDDTGTDQTCQAGKHIVYVFLHLI